MNDLIGQIQRVLMGARRFLKTRKEIHLLQEPAQIYSVEDPTCIIKLNAITLRAKEGTITINQNGVFLAPLSDDGFITLLNTNKWCEIADWEEGDM